MASGMRFTPYRPRIHEDGNVPVDSDAPSSASIDVDGKIFAARLRARLLLPIGALFLSGSPLCTSFTLDGRVDSGVHVSPLSVIYKRANTPVIDGICKRFEETSCSGDGRFRRLTGPVIGNHFEDAFGFSYKRDAVAVFDPSSNCY